MRMRSHFNLPAHNAPADSRPHDKDQRQTAAYISDMLLELRLVAQAARLRHLTYLLELAIYEAFEIANRKPPQTSDFRAPNETAKG